MYILFLTMKTPNGLAAIFILLYSIILAFICPYFRKKGKYAVMSILCVLPVVFALFHFIIYGSICFWAFWYLYLESLLPLIHLLPGKSGKLTAVKSVVSSVSVFAFCALFLINTTNMHNYTRYSYIESFAKMLDTMEEEYCLNSWKQIDYDALLEEYLPKVEEAEKNNDESAYAAIITEVTYKFYDSHVYTELLSFPVYKTVCEELAGNDYGLSMVRTSDGGVIAVFVEPDHEADPNCTQLSDVGSELNELGIHNGTQILSWDGADIEEAIADVECIYTMLQFPVKSNEDVFCPIFLAGKDGESVTVTFLDDEGNEKSANLKRIGNYSKRLNTTLKKFLHGGAGNLRNNYTCMLDDKCGYLQIIGESYDPFLDDIAVVRKGYYPELTEYYAEMIDELKKQGMEYLVIDIRNNVGGYDCCAGALTSLFTDEKKHMVSYGYEDNDGYHIKENQYIFPDGRYKDLPVAVLVNSTCASAGDGMAKFLDDCDNVTLMGFTASAGVNQNTGGYIYLTENICVEYPCFLSLSSDGNPFIDTDNTIENRIPIDVTIPLTKETALNLFSFEECDLELEYVVEYLE
ncbi:MAG: S41 family peptidase [Ruminococcus flavefaciens]|nr:S41 family peptidase [Ruminococcus flavefaciens]MCM1230407.1 S41 family peptidase [Ruminococcus flavefaciens]